MNKKKLSKFLSFVLRHKPDALSLKMDKKGWVDLDELLEKMQAAGKTASREEVELVVQTNDKQRFMIDAKQNKIRANQGHSIKVNLELRERIPPAILYHGTAYKNLRDIRAKGLKKMKRQHVHLSKDIHIAKSVGTRHGVPTVLKIDCLGMLENGSKFYLSANNVWLTNDVPVRFITFE
ncbi:MAG: RNA 2'-phosphotransferase [Chitinophagales bacterium]